MPLPRPRHRTTSTAARTRRGRAGVVAALTAAVVLASACGSGGRSVVAPATPAAPVDIGAGLTGPAGLQATVAATGLANVAALATDDDGRLWAATAAFEDRGTDAVLLIDPATGTGTEVVTDLVTPKGLRWSQGWLYVASLGRVDAFRGFDPETGAFAEQRAVLELGDEVGLSGQLAVAADGRLSLAISAPCDACDPGSELAGSVISFEPDGSDRRVDARDLRAPVGLAYHPDTGDLYATLNQRDDLGDATPGDLLAVVEPGQSWGFPDCTGLGAVPGADPSVCAEVPRPVAELGRHAAVSDVAIVTGQLGPTVGTAAVVAEWATGRVAAVGLSSGVDGSTPGPVSELVGGLQKPVAVLLAPDGTVLLGDWATGTVYRIGRTAGTPGSTAGS